MTTLKLQYVGGPTAVLEYAGTRLLTDPTFDEPGDYPLPDGRKLTKLHGPGVDAGDIGPIDAVLLSHDQHADNLDQRGRALLADVPLTLSTPDAAERIDSVTGLAPWATAEVRDVTITAVPARHGPEGAESVTGAVTGFVLRAPGAPAVYISGDNANPDHIADVEQRLGPITIAVLFAGAVRIPHFDVPITLTSEEAAAAVATLPDATIVALHTEDWAHFTEGPERVEAAFADAGVTDRLVLPRRGEWISI
ncbi:MBL fold metallo-hydrolase [Epidermidibacterium keratini]|uniref:MBL fold metallo-hydrolase n=1 Tax=Epidermidibacterium keratini TaxID=1891644 RepID=A0A7L4YLD7_9ACTN|nr:MBL fold metallo-hydrolase [Epidermidibacterium keratini]QHB99653.1 MBL fold metallo-hydrolase [Epidermidibacterium keratini]